MRLTTILALACGIVVTAIVGTHIYRTKMDPGSTVWTYMGEDDGSAAVMSENGRDAAAERWHSIRSRKVTDQVRPARAKRTASRRTNRPTRLSANGFGSSHGHVQDRTFGRALQVQRSRSIFEGSRRYKMWGSHTQPHRQRRDQIRRNSRRR